jgi:hypothetical protein
MTELEISSFQQFCAPLIGMPVTHIWRGYGTALFLEFGDLHPRRLLDGSSGNPAGDWELMITSGWRIEERGLALCDSESDDSRWQQVFRRLMNTKVERTSLIGEPSEVAVDFSNEFQLISMTVAQDSPHWTLFDNRKNPATWAAIKSGALKVETNPPNITSAARA